MPVFGDESVIADELPRESNDSTDAFARWVCPHWDDLNRLARRLCGMDGADDVVQEALSAAWRKRAQFDPARGSARAWLMAVVADQARKKHRRARPSILSGTVSWLVTADRFTIAKPGTGTLDLVRG